ncbi:protein UsfY [Mycolicibacterium sp. 120270]|uniref:protein UsfY n=1 Tax=Mycolicibacterium sp. 120270 TaxID=3090600 RepID=UPI00299EC20E|nr:protein UsfY [Mycolicibacterium sp. 120270]MDX1884127.1 protein UsfY [Mycolicibacterium sp. 120270]
MKSPKDPVDHSRTTRPHAGETMKDTKEMPALIVIGVALVSFVGALAAHATNHHSTGIMLGSISAALLAVGLVWLAVEHRRVRGIEERWYAEHPEAYRQRPSS